ncbi:itaconyl-CoA hydratase / mesaconyl-C4 CoA hydratase [Modicisalibacter muralis]|uniref:Itaconyl-CoA hydratase / mesaconyl-C4 CoA hydratase n=1 Tax=Modicisalibacter muralis TaxID=119000 RepID=A0A1G9GWD6_9GAMM|nr:MaoC family dehydratase N-terminal domain-containing protein [Halomonas muralis]SDL04865.1 itaconyl-CoA hydratase / mesaconyl-C4 CoA hydratase [Halomonas muralis]
MAGDPTDDWLGRKEYSNDTLAPALVKRLAATFGQPAPEQGAALPPLWHWAFFQEPLSAEGLGLDGHPARGGFLPPAENRNRMWAGGRIDFLAPLKVGVEAQRESTIAKIDEKHGRTGKLLFVTVRHEYRQDGLLTLQEEQDIVYREPSPPRLSLDDDLPSPEWSETIEPTSTLLFRYSAATFNGHRIHYDWPYATEQEGYPGLVVHGPMIATLMVRAFKNANPDALLTHLAYRGLRPLIAPEPFRVAGRSLAPGKAELWAVNSMGPAHRAELEYQESR